MSEQRLINANELLRNAEDYGPISGELAGFYDVKWLVDAQPTVDAVIVTRCKDCRNSEMHTDFSGKKYLGCTLDPDVIYEVDPDHFCAYGERTYDDGEG